MPVRVVAAQLLADPGGPAVGQRQLVLARGAQVEHVRHGGIDRVHARGHVPGARDDPEALRPHDQRRRGPVAESGPRTCGLTHPPPPRIAVHPAAAARGLEPPVEDVGLADEVRHEQRHRPLVEILAAAQLLDLAVVEDGDPVAHDQRLLLVVGDVDHRGAQLAADVHDLELERLAELLVQGAQRLVHEQQGRLEHDRARQRDALLLAAGHLARVAGRVGIQLHQAQGVVHAALDLGLGELPHLERERDVLARRHVREQGVVLEHHAHVALVGRDPADVVAVDLDGARGLDGEPRDHPQGRRLARAGRPEQRDELTLPDVEVHAVDGSHVAEVTSRRPRRTSAGRSLGGLCVRRDALLIARAPVDAPRGPASARRWSRPAAPSPPPPPSDRSPGGPVPT